jgi:very-short-patch-repair endonuclease
MARTLYDLVRRVGLVEAVVVADMALHSGVIDLAELTTFVAARSGRKGVAAARPLLDLVEPAAESPMESRLRMLLVLGGLSRPQAQVSLHADDGEFLGRADLYYPGSRLVMEYDGETHRSSLVDDNRRQNRLLSAGFRVLRFTAADVLRSPGAVLTQVRTAVAGG